jgi:DNA-binding transcriptional regulator YdaS (Cro superfamily)
MSQEIPKNPENNAELVDRVIRAVGSQARLASMLGVRQQTVSWWRKRTGVPVEYCALVERATGGQITRKELRADDWQTHWPELARKPRSRAAKAQPLQPSATR